MSASKYKIGAFRLAGLFAGSVGALMLGHTAYVILADVEVFSVFTGLRGFTGLIVLGLGWGLTKLDASLKEARMSEGNG